ncbi:PREDICTED: uncharacterized protein LOC104612285 [Nelumbo nucifera]|uniref:Uncharacterized protein LOC104612285 n=1 Tax=Nelumbo nucifera TaxID=4432 RepID=A0A1U8B9U8_NELNU|nr:PREDICTED: uncharacterized protein LOC104612285 [Nelumbo nucifera]
MRNIFRFFIIRLTSLPPSLTLPPPVGAPSLVAASDTSSPGEVLSSPSSSQDAAPSSSTTESTDFALQPSSSLHPMTTRARHGIFKPNPRYALLASPLVESKPTCYSQAHKDPRWVLVMTDEYKALLQNKTWTLVPAPPDKNITRNKWVFKIKRKSDGSVERFKARLVAKGFSQEAGSSSSATNTLIQNLASQFSLRDLGSAYYFLGVELYRPSYGLHLSQHKYIDDLLNRAQLHDAKPLSTPMSTSARLTKSESEPLTDPTFFHSIVGALQYVTITHPEITFAVNKSSKEQPIVARSSIESKYRSLASTAVEFLWLHMLLQELGVSLSVTPLIWCGNMGAKFLANNPALHSRSKHIELDIHFIREKVATKLLDVRYIPSAD